MSRPSHGALAPFESLVRVKILGRSVELPANNTLLRGLAWLEPESVTCGKFCWNGECNNSKFYFRLPGETVERKARACRFPARDGMEITVLSTELRWVLRGLLARLPAEEPEDEPVETAEATPDAAGGTGT